MLFIFCIAGGLVWCTWYSAAAALVPFVHHSSLYEYNVARVDYGGRVGGEGVCVRERERELLILVGMQATPSRPTCTSVGSDT